jgi:hypothetical protein
VIRAEILLDLGKEEVLLHGGVYHLRFVGFMDAFAAKRRELVAVLILALAVTRNIGLLVLNAVTHRRPVKWLAGVPDIVGQDARGRDESGRLVLRVILHPLENLPHPEGQNAAVQFVHARLGKGVEVLVPL